MRLTFGQLLMELEGIKKSDPKLLENAAVLRTDAGDTFVELAVTLPSRELILLSSTEYVDAG